MINCMLESNTSKHRALGPGQGVLCGQIECHKYASCNMKFGFDEEAVCTCPEGFYGDGITDCDTTAPEPEDCRTGPECGPNAECTYQMDTKRFTCMCGPGYYGDGAQCYPTRETPVPNTEEKHMDPYDKDRDNYYPSYVPPSQQATTESPRSRDTTQSWLQPFIPTQVPDSDDENAPMCLFGVCTCANDLIFYGEINKCVEKPLPFGFCRTKDDCDPKALCEYDEYDQGYRCKCMPKYVGDGKSCEPGPDAGCDILKNCHSDAKCMEDGEKYYCRCSPGYLGDGYNCEKEPQIGCNVIDNCGRFAQCIFDRYERGYKCVCDEQRGFTGDGYTCTPSVSCFENRAICDPNADCIPTPDYNSKCVCKQMFLGDGFKCEPAPRFEGNFMLLAQGMMLFKVPFSGKGSKPINVLSSQVASGIDIDCMKGQVYWSDTTNKLIKRASIDGKNAETYISESMKFPEGLAIDWVSRNMYWTDAGKDTIEVVNIEDGTR